MQPAAPVATETAADSNTSSGLGRSALQTTYCSNCATAIPSRRQMKRMGAIKRRRKCENAQANPDALYRMVFYNARGIAGKPQFPEYLAAIGASFAGVVETRSYKQDLDSEQYRWEVGHELCPTGRQSFAPRGIAWFVYEENKAPSCGCDECKRTATWANVRRSGALCSACAAHGLNQVSVPGSLPGGCCCARPGLNQVSVPGSLPGGCIRIEIQ